MPSNSQPTARPYWSSGRGFASADPERQREVIGYVRKGSGESAGPARTAAAVKPAQAWTRIQPDVDGSGFEGSSSGRWR